MSTNVKEYLLQALRLMLKPLVKLFISQGVTHAEFSETAKEVYVEIALRHFETEGRINKSRIAILTGLTRKEVKNVIDRALESGPQDKLYSRPERVLAGWYGDPNYTGPYGIPLELPYETNVEGESSFISLVKTYSGDMAPRQMLKELVRSGSVVEMEGRFKAVSRLYEPTAFSPELIVRLGEIGHRFFSTAAMNIEKKGQGTGHFDRLVYADEGCTQNVIEMFDQYIKPRGQEFLEELDVWFTTNQKKNVPTEQRRGTGLYMVHYVDADEEKVSLKELLRDRKTSSSEKG
jgi:hypothetical protein